MQLTINSQKHQKFASVVYLSFFLFTRSSLFQTGFFVAQN